MINSNKIFSASFFRYEYRYYNSKTDVTYNFTNVDRVTYYLDIIKGESFEIQVIYNNEMNKLVK